MRHLLLTLAVVFCLSVAAAVALPDDASAHVRDKDKHRMCNGYGGEMRHFHDPGPLQDGYYFHTKFGRWSGKYIIYHTWKTIRIPGRYDEQRRVVNCRRF